jgi:hypothetical protein
MRIKNALIGFLFIISSITASAQIKIDDVGDGWKDQIDSALMVIKKHDPVAYNEVINYCDHISFWLGHHSTTQYPSSVIVAVQDMKLKSVNNLACLIVHEVVHLEFHKKNVDVSGNVEELAAYTVEKEFAKKIPNIEPWILSHIDKQIDLYRALVRDE